jgi:hypothetical protein
MSDEHQPAEPKEDPAELAPSQDQVQPPDQVDRKQIAQFVTTIKNAEQQVGEHIIQALQHSDTVAVLTTVVMAPDGQQHVVSAALDPERLQQVQEILQAAEAEREKEEPCIGFHCFVKSKRDKPA